MIRRQHSPPPPPHQCCSAAVKKTGSSSGLQSYIELGGGGSEGLVLSRRCFLQGSLEYMRKICTFLSEICRRLNSKTFLFMEAMLCVKNIPYINSRETYERRFF